MEPHLISQRFAATVDEQLSEFDALKSAVMHVAHSAPGPTQRVILCNSLVVGLTARIEEALRQICNEYLRIVEDCHATFFDFKDDLKKASFSSALMSLKKNENWDDAKRKIKELDELLSGERSFKLAVALLVNNQGNMRSSEVTDIAKRIGLNGLWRAVAADQWFVERLGEDNTARLEGLIVQKWNAVFDERDNVVHRVSQANGWSTDVIDEHIDFCRHVVKVIGSIFNIDCSQWLGAIVAD